VSRGLLDLHDSSAADEDHNICMYHNLTRVCDVSLILNFDSRDPGFRSHDVEPLFA
jgi:hypothetical protein